MESLLSQALCFSVVLVETTGLHGGAVANLNPLGRKLGAIIVQTPGGHVLWRAILHADDNVAIPRPGMITVIFARPCRMVGMGMIPADHFKALLTCRLFRCQYVFRSHGKSVARRIVAPIDERKKLQDFPRGSVLCRIALQDGARIASKQRAAAFVRVSSRAMCTDVLRKVPANPDCTCVRHNYASSQKRSFRYFEAESANTVTITACSLFGISDATWKQPSNAAAALGLTSKPSSRARRFTSR